MSTNIGDELLATDLINWYNTLNATINVGGNQGKWKTSGGTVITSITVPSSASLKGTDIYASQIYAITDRINQLKTDTYIQSQPTFYSSYDSALYSTTATVTYAVRAGCIIYTNALIPVVNTINTWSSSIKCRNLATYSKGMYASGYHSSGSKGNGSCTSGSYSCTLKSNIVNSHSPYAHGTRTYGTNNSGIRSCNTKGHGTCSSGSYSSGGNTNMKKTHGVNQYTTCGCGTRTHGSCSSSSYTNSCNSSTFGSGYDTCTTKSSGSKQHGTNLHVKHNNVNYSCGRYSSGTVIDILCANATYVHGS